MEILSTANRIIANGSHFLNLAQSWIQNLNILQTFDEGKKINDFDKFF